MKHLIFAFLLIIFYRVSNNISLLIRTSYYSKKYNSYLAGKTSDFFKYEPSVAKLFKAANIEECIFPVAEPVGYGYIHTTHVNHFSNLSNLRQDIATATIQCFGQAQTIFRSRIIETFSPLYWVRSILFLPKQLFIYLGVNAGSVLIKIAQVIYWIATPLLIAFRDNIYQYITTLLS